MTVTLRFLDTSCSLSCWQSLTVLRLKKNYFSFQAICESSNASKM